jgi:hypothetical protein
MAGLMLARWMYRVTEWLAKERLKEQPHAARLTAQGVSGTAEVRAGRDFRNEHHPAEHWRSSRKQTRRKQARALSKQIARNSNLRRKTQMPFLVSETAGSAATPETQPFPSAYRVNPAVSWIFSLSIAA